MASKIQLTRNGRVFGAVTIFDGEPSFELIHAVFPGPLKVVHYLKHDTWFVDLLDAPAPMLAD